MKKCIFFMAAVIWLLTVTVSARAQLIGGNIFLQGHYLEIGIAPNGAMGGGPVPAGYHPTPAINKIGIRYDPGHDGWTTGSPPAFGDYIMVGNPFEGWSMQVNGSRYDAFYTYGSLGDGTQFTPGLSGSNVAYTNTGGTVSGIWRGSCAGLDIKQTSSIGAEDSWMTNTVVFVNTTASPIADVYYWRTMDPDGDQTVSTNFNTINRIVYQNDTGHRVLVGASGAVYSAAYVSLGARDARARSMIYESWAPYPLVTAGNSLDKVYNQTATSLGATWYNVGGTVPAAQDIAIGIIFKLGTIAPGDSAIFRYVVGLGDSTDIDSVAAVQFIAGPRSVCAGSNISLAGTPSGGTWMSSNTSIATVSNTGMVTGVSGGNTNIDYTVAGATVSYSVSVAAGVPTISGTLTICAGFSPTLTAAPADGVWASGNTSIATITQGGVYSGVNGGVTTISYSNGCGIATRTVTINKWPVNIYGTTVVPLAARVYLCAGNTTTLSNNGYPLGTWGSSDVAVATINTITGVLSSTGITGTTRILCNNQCGGSYVDLYVATPTSISGNLVLCQPVSTTMLSNGAAPGTWTSGNTAVATIESATGTVHVVPGGTGLVPVHYAFAGGCGVDTTLVVTDVPLSIAGGTTVCVGSGISLSNAIAGGTWSSGNTNVATVDSLTGIVRGIAAGTSMISYVTACGAVSMQVSVGMPAFVAAGTAQVCSGSVIELSNATSGGTWSSSNTIAATVTGAGVVTGGSLGTAIVIYSLPSCVVYSTTVSVLPATDVGVIDGPSLVCVGTTIWLTDAVAGGGWSSANTAAAVVAVDGMVTGVATGAATISYTINSSCGMAAATKDIEVKDLPDAGVITGPDRVCEGAVIVLSDGVPGGVWSVSDTGAVVSAGGVLTGMQAGSAVVSYTANNVCGAATATVTVTVVITPAAGIITGIDTLCKNAIITLGETEMGGVWSTSNDTVAGINAVTGELLAISNGVAILSYTVSNGECAGVATFTTTVAPPSFTINAALKQIACFGDRNGGIEVTILGHAPAYNLLWSGGQTTAAIAGLDTGLYALQVSEPLAQCTADTTFRIYQPEAIIILDSTAADECGKGKGAVWLTLSGGVPGYAYMWSTTAATPGIEGLHAGVYTVTVTDGNNCMMQHTATVADSVCIDIMVHDVITPNGDGYNDVWIIEGLSRYPENSVQVFNKWGDIIYDKRNYKNDWGGQSKNGLLPDGTYYYLVKLNAPNSIGIDNTFTGSLLIKR